ncbi:MAG TPA: hypothetical protein VKG89_03970 [Solirubrobacterales bacterium]|nr:hypothetical protein [Solirubrobacterales bacterium]
MNLWHWTKSVVTDQTGGIEPVPVAIERNPGAVVELGAENPPGVPLYLLRVGVRGGFGGTQAGLPVHRRENPAPHPVLKEIYQCEVAGKVLEAANIYALRAKVQRQLEVIAPARSLPLCYFRAPRYDYSLAVYEEGSHLVCPVLAGPRIRAESLAEMRDPVVDHLRAAGYLMAADEPEVVVLRPSDLRLVPPAAVIRGLDDPGLWLPTVEGVSADGPVVGLLSHPTQLVAETRLRRGTPAREAPPSAPDVSGLLRWITGEMTVRGRLRTPWSLYASEVRPEIWARTEELTDPTDRTLSAHLDGGTLLEVPVRHTAAGEAVGAIREVGITVFLAGDHDALAAVIGRYLAAAGFLRDAGELRPELIREAPPERLDPDSIWTGTTMELDTANHHDQEVSTT